MLEKFLKLTNAVYKVLEFFPESDPLKNRAKDRALVIMDNLALVNENSGWISFQKEKIKVQILEDIDILLGYLWIGKSQGWLNSSNYLIISNEYEKIKKATSPLQAGDPRPEGREMEPIIVPIIEQTQKLPGILDKSPAVTGQFDELASISPEANLGGERVSISDRQKKILNFLEKNETGQVMDLQTVLPNITKRTIRRDLDELLEASKIVRLGDFNQVFYKLA